MRRHGAGGWAGTVKEESGSFLKKRTKKLFFADPLGTPVALNVPDEDKIEPTP